MEDSGEDASDLHLDITIMIAEMDTLQYDWGDNEQKSDSYDIRNITAVMVWNMNNVTRYISLL